jgi:hypothetical protein
MSESFPVKLPAGKSQRVSENVGANVYPGTDYSYDDSPAFTLGAGERWEVVREGPVLTMRKSMIAALETGSQTGVASSTPASGPNDSPGRLETSAAVPAIKCPECGGQVEAYLVEGYDRDGLAFAIGHGLIRCSGCLAKEAQRSKAQRVGKLMVAIFALMWVVFGVYIAVRKH